MRILITGGLGFIGSAVAAAALQAGHDVGILDNASAARPEVADRIEAIAGRAPRVVRGDIRDADAVRDALHGADTVIHCAGLKSVVESATRPLGYYDVNVGGLRQVLQAMADASCHRIVFSSSATVYGTPEHLPITERQPVGRDLTNPYGRTKYVGELMLRDAAAAHSDWQVTILRYFNPIGAHESGLLGEDPASTPTNVFPLIAEVAGGRRDALTITGTDYPTPDGTGIRDYIHITDLAEGHLAALRRDEPGCRTYNLGTGRGTSVRELVDAYAAACGHPLATVDGSRRPGDIASCYADPTLAHTELSWTARRTIADACRDSWAWQQTLAAARAVHHR